MILGMSSCDVLRLIYLLKYCSAGVLCNVYICFLFLVSGLARVDISC